MAPLGMFYTVAAATLLASVGVVSGDSGVIAVARMLIAALHLCIDHSRQGSVARCVLLGLHTPKTDKRLCAEPPRAEPPLEDPNVMCAGEAGVALLSVCVGVAIGELHGECLACVLLPPLATKQVVQGANPGREYTIEDLETVHLFLKHASNLAQ